MIRFAHPGVLALVAVAVALLIVAGALAAKPRSVSMAALRPLARARRTPRQRLRPLVAALYVAALVLLALAAARPQVTGRPRAVRAEVIDIMLVLDVSSSMGSPDFQPLNRLEVAKTVVGRFVDARAGDRLGLIAFARFSVLRCPLTLDHEVLVRQLETTEMAEGRDDGTAIGMALASAVNHLRRSPARSRVVLLLTDGDNNRSTVDPGTGAALARALGVTVYAVGVGRARAQEGASSGQADPESRAATFNEEALEAIAQTTGGAYFRAEDPEALAEVLSTVDSLQRSEVITRTYGRATELYAYPAAAALVLCALALALDSGPLRRLP